MKQKFKKALNKNSDTSVKDAASAALEMLWVFALAGLGSALFFAVGALIIVMPMYVTPWLGLLSVPAGLYFWFFVISWRFKI